MDYQTFQPHPDLATIVKCFWTLEVPAQEQTQKQLILPDGCVDICFILGDDIKRYLNDVDYLLQPRQMLLGQISEKFYIEPTGYVNTFAIRFYPYGFTNFIKRPLNELANKETPLNELFEKEAATQFGTHIIQARNTQERINITENFLFDLLSSKEVVKNVVTSTVDAMLTSKGSRSLNSILDNQLPKRRQLERNFKTQIGISPKQLAKIFRLQATLNLLLNQDSPNMTDIAYENEFYDQAHFIKDFKEFTGVTPKEFLSDPAMLLSSNLYKDRT